MTPTEATLKHIQDLGAEQAAQHFGKTVSAMKTVLRTKKVTGEMIDKYYASFRPAVPNSTVVSATYPSGEEDTDVVEEKLNDLHGRLKGVEGLSERFSSLEEQLGRFFASQTVGTVAESNSAIRPARSVYGSNSVQEPQPNNSFEPDKGMAPTAIQARKSATGGKGLPAGPAKQKDPIQPGEPGTWDWNMTKEEMKANKAARLEARKQLEIKRLTAQGK